MALKDIKARIAAVAGQVQGAGMVYARMRPVNVEAMEQSQFVQNGVLNCAFVTRGTAEWETRGDMPWHGAQWDTVSVHMFYAVNDGNDSEDAFEALANATLLALFQDANYPGFFNGTAKRTRPPRLKAEDFRHFGTRQVLCHHAEITVQVMTQTS